MAQEQLEGLQSRLLGTKKRHIPTCEFIGRFNSKKDLCRYIRQNCKARALFNQLLLLVQYYLPPTGQVTKDFLKQVVNEEKDLLPVSEVKWVNMPQYDELSVSNLWPQVKTQKEVMKYIPSKFRKGQQCSRAYFFNVLNTVLPAYVDKLIKHANNKRMDAGIDDPKLDYIELSDRWYKELMAFPFVSSKQNSV